MAFRSVPRPSSPPGAKASTECPYHTPIQDGSRPKPEPPTMHGNHRQTSCCETCPRYRERTRGEPRSCLSSLPADLNHQSSSAQNPDVFHSLRRMEKNP